jgi:hypothetical protein
MANESLMAHPETTRAAIVLDCAGARQDEARLPDRIQKKIPVYCVNTAHRRDSSAWNRHAHTSPESDLRQQERP